MHPISDQEPARTVVATHAAFRATEEDADYLASRGFPPHRVGVHVRELRLMKRRLTLDAYLRRAARGGLLLGTVGALLGLWVGRVLLALPVGTVLLVVVAGGAVASAAIGVAGGAGAHALWARWKGQHGVEILLADGFDVAVDDQLAEAARRLLHPARRQPDETEPSSRSKHPRSDPPGTAIDGDGVTDCGGHQP